MNNYNELLKHISNCDDIYCPCHKECSIDSEECVECFKNNEYEYRDNYDAY